MKKVFLMLMAAIPALLFAQTPDNYTLKGKVGTLNTPARAYLIYQLDGKNKSDSVNITNGEFKFHGNVGDPVQAYVVIDPTGIGFAKLKPAKNAPVDFLDLYLDKGNIVLSDADSVSKAKISGSKLNDENQKFKAMLKPFVERGAAINYEYKSAPDAQQINPSFQDTIAARYKALQTEQTAAIKQFITNNPQSYMSLVAMQSLVKAGTDVTTMEPYFVKLTPAIQQTELGKGFGSAFKELKFTAIGSLAPDFTQNDISGAPVKLSSLRGKYVLLDFWASWCGPCRQENPHIVRVFDHYKDKNFTILGVSLDKTEDKALWLKAIKDDGLNWTQVSDLKYWNNEAAELYKVNFIPQNYLIDPDGKIIGKNLKGADLDAKLTAIFKM